MLVRKTDKGWTPWDFGPVNGTVFQRDIEQKWSDAELAVWGFKRVPAFSPPDGKVATGALRLVEQPDGSVVQVFDVVDAPPRQVLKSVIIDRLQKLGMLEKASQALNADLYARERWYSPDKPTVDVNHPDVLAMLQTIGADPAVILAP